MAAAPGITTTGSPPNAVVQIQGGMNVQPVVLVDQNGNYQATSGSAATAGLLADLTGTVNVAAATAPSSGQVLTATGASAATWQTPQTGFNNPMTTVGDLISENTVPSAVRVAGNTTATQMFLAQTGTGTASALPIWSTIGTSSLPVIPIAGGGSGQTTATAAYNALSPMTTKGDIEYDSANATAARLGIGTVNQVLTVGASTVPTWGQGMSLLATTGIGGYALVNGTGNAVTWAAPSDGAMHRVLVFATLHVSTAQTAGAIQAIVTIPDGTSNNKAMFAGGLSSNEYYSTGPAVFLVEGGTSLSVFQSSAQTGGAAVLFAELWGS